MKYLKPKLLGCLLIAPALMLGLAPDRAFSARALSQPIVGQVTATPTGNEIEVDHHPYRIKANSPAAKTAPTLAVGQKISLILDGPAGDARASVIGIGNEAGT